VLLIPAIDLRGGRCVRLAQGDPSQEKRYDDDPVARARSFVAAGARRLHVVDLDGAFGSGENLDSLRAICAAVAVPVQTGGGIRSLEAAAARFTAGAATIVLGTVLLEEPAVARAIVERYGDRVIGGVDARGGRVAVRGWQTEGGVERDALIRQLEAWGFARIVYTEIARDGMGTGYDLAALGTVARATTMRVTASGGAHSIEDLRALAETAPPNLDSAIVGRALYEGTIDLAAALAALCSQGEETRP
jgi:phosphoribosylformimino-5-aminoimidazole carboxamide ribotide isomerase